MEDQTLIHNLEGNKTSRSVPFFHFLSYIGLAVGLGVIVGFGLTKFQQQIKNKINQKIKTKKTIGIVDKKTFRDQAEGILREGGIDGEGNFHLERPGGESQNVYLTSSTIDLSKYIGKKVRVWGETFSAEKAGWLMDVGLVELLQ